MIFKKESWRFGRCSARIVKCVVTLLGTAFFAGCGDGAAYETQDFVMGTIVKQRLHGANARQVAAEALARLRELEARLSFYWTDSDIAKLNRSAGGPGIALHPETIGLLDRSARFAEMSGGAFNVLVGPLVKRWSVTSDAPDIPTAAEITSLRRLATHRDLRVDSQRGTARLARRGQMADLGGIAKGYATDVVIGLYRTRGIRSAIVDLGGNIGLLGSRPGGETWRVGVQDPFAKRGAYVGHLELVEKCVSTSAGYERFFISGGKRYSHIIDPRTGYPAESGLASATIVADSSVDSDALSTAVYVLGLARGMDLVKRCGAQAVCITDDRKIVATEGLRTIFTLADRHGGYVVTYQ